jgi:hypothetical protein
VSTRKEKREDEFLNDMEPSLVKIEVVSLKMKTRFFNLRGPLLRFVNETVANTKS